MVNFQVFVRNVTLAEIHSVHCTIMVILHFKLFRSVPSTSPINKDTHIHKACSKQTVQDKIYITWDMNI